MPDILLICTIIENGVNEKIETIESINIVDPKFY